MGFLSVLLDQIPLQLDREKINETQDSERGVCVCVWGGGGGGDDSKEAIILDISIKGGDHARKYGALFGDSTHSQHQETILFLEEGCVQNEAGQLSKKAYKPFPPQHTMNGINSSMDSRH